MHSPFLPISPLSDIEPSEKRVNLRVLVLDALTACEYCPSEEEKERGEVGVKCAEFVIADDTASAVFTAIGDDLIRVFLSSHAVELRQVRVRVIERYLRVVADRWSDVTAVREDKVGVKAEHAVTLPNRSFVEYALQYVDE
mmetsp:Transcript_19542/g.50051  ORF Transcript_19542/g.50051 Transcript_19542/m.50051 type:complete len:141 (-) Transcript_19542:306-728(-)